MGRMANRPGNLSLLTLLPHAPELNPIQNVWAYLRSNKLAITVFDSYDAIVTKRARHGTSSRKTPQPSNPPPHEAGSGQQIGPSV